MIFMNHPDKEPLINEVLLENGVPVSKCNTTETNL